MKRSLVFFFVLFGVISLALNSFNLQTGGNGVISAGFNSGYGSPSDLYGIVNSAFSTNFMEITRSASPLVNERHLYVQLFEDSDDNMAGALQYYMDIGPGSSLRSLSYTISGNLGALTTYGADLKVNMHVATATTYDFALKGGISGKAFKLLDYVAAFESTIWSSGSNKNIVDLLVGVRFVPDPFVIGLELGTRNGMEIRYFGLSTQYTYNKMFSVRGGVSMNIDLENNMDFIIGGGIDVMIGNMLITGGIGTNLNRKIPSIAFEKTWNVAIMGKW